MLEPVFREGKKEVERESVFYPTRYMTWDEYRFWDYLKKNLKLYRRLIAVTRSAKSGVTFWGIDGICAVARYLFTFEGRPERYKMTNNYRPFFARFIMENNPDLDGFFVVKEQFRNKGSKIPKHKLMGLRSQVNVNYQPTEKDERIIEKLATTIKVRG